MIAAGQVPAAPRVGKQGGLLRHSETILYAAARAIEIDMEAWAEAESFRLANLG